VGEGKEKESGSEAPNSSWSRKELVERRRAANRSQKKVAANRLQKKRKKKKKKRKRSRITRSGGDLKGRGLSAFVSIRETKKERIQEDTNVRNTPDGEGGAWQDLQRITQPHSEKKRYEGGMADEVSSTGKRIFTFSRRSGEVSTAIGKKKG